MRKRTSGLEDKRFKKKRRGIKIMKKVMILNGQYAPGYKGGGPIQSCINMVNNLSDIFDFYVLCADRDLKSEDPYKNIAINQWNQVGFAKVYYMNQEKQTINGFTEILNEIDYDILYLNGFFSPLFTIKPLLARLLGKLNKSKIILAPRGDFTGGCENKKLKKYLYIYLSRLIGMYNNLLWHATSELEEKSIKKLFPNAEIFVASNLSTKFFPKKLQISKIPGELRLVFLSRIFPKKNIKYALEVLKQVKGNVIFDIYGSMEDKIYWKECTALINKMPVNVKVQYCGEVPHSEIENVFSKYHAFFFPTLGENYGHVIVEAMMNNCVVILGKGVTPWDEYGSEMGLLGELDNQKTFVSIIERLVSIDAEKFRELVLKNNHYITKEFDAPLVKTKYKEMFQ